MALQIIKFDTLLFVGMKPLLIESLKSGRYGSIFPLFSTDNISGMSITQALSARNGTLVIYPAA